VPLSGICTSGDSVLVYLNDNLTKRLACSVSGTFSTTLNLEEPGRYEIYAISKNVAGSLSAPSETVVVEYVEQMGIRVDERLDGDAVIELNLPKQAREVILRIYSIGGSYIQTVTKESPEQFDEMTWDLTDSDGKPVKNGPCIMVFEVNYLDGGNETDKKAVVVVR
jgi:hypothetical protein